MGPFYERHAPIRGCDRPALREPLDDVWGEAVIDHAIRILRCETREGGAS
jgi:hypothetical protein